MSVHNSVGGVSTLNQALPQQPTGLDGSATAAKSGKTQAGLAVVATNQPTLANSVANMSEEVGALRANFKRPDELKISKGKSSLERQLELIEKIKLVEDIPPTHDFKRRFPEDSRQNFKKEDYLKEAKEHFKDPYHQYLALHELAVQFKAEPDDELSQAIKALENEHPQYIEIGKEISKAAGKLVEKYSQDHTHDEIHQKVFGHVKDHKSLLDVFKDLHGEQESIDFEKSVDRRLKNLSSELNVLTATTEDSYLRSIINDMTALKRLVGIHDSCQETEGEMRRPPINVEQFDGDRYMENTLKLLNQQFVTDNDFTLLMDCMGLTEQSIQVKIAFINKTAALIRDIPEEIFANEQIKESLVSAVTSQQDALAIAEEGGSTADKNYGTKGEVEITDGTLNNFLDSNPVSSNILQDLGSDFKGTQNPIPGIMKPSGIPQFGQTTSDQQSDGEQGSAVQSKNKPDTPDISENVPKTTDNPSDDIKTQASIDITDKKKVEEPESVKKQENLDGLSEKELFEKQNELLDKARRLHQRKDSDYVYQSSLMALQHAEENGGSDMMAALQYVAKNRGKQFADDLKVSITPAGEGKPLKLIPPDQKALKVWLASHPDQSLTDLVKTAIEVLQENRDDDVDLDKIDKELASLRETIVQIDNKIGSKSRKSLKEMFKNPFKEGPYTDRLQAFIHNPMADSILPQWGADIFDQLEFSHSFHISAEGKKGAVESSLKESEQSDVVDRVNVKEGANKSYDTLAYQGISESRKPFAGRSGSVRKG